MAEENTTAAASASLSDPYGFSSMRDMISAYETKASDLTVEDRFSALGRLITELICVARVFSSAALTAHDLALANKTLTLMSTSRWRSKSRSQRKEADAALEAAETRDKDLKPLRQRIDVLQLLQDRLQLSGATDENVSAALDILKKSFRSL